VKWVVIGLVLLLAILHQDFWWWDDRSIVLGFLPISLAWHVGISLGAGFVWWLAVTFSWPAELDEGSGAAGAERLDGGEPTDGVGGRS